jgi:hypothetical protein
MPRISAILLVTSLVLTAAAGTAGCRHSKFDVTIEPDSGTDSDTDTDTDSDSDSDSDSDTDTSTHYEGPIVPQTCEQAEQTATTVGCLFYAVDLDSHDSVETGQFAVVVANVNQEDTATVTVDKGNGTDWIGMESTAVPSMGTHRFDLPDFHMNSSGLMPKGSFRIESDVPIVAYQFNPIDGATSYLSDASVLIPVPSLGLDHDVVGWKQNQGDGDMRAYFTVIATTDGTEITVDPSVAPLGGGVVPSSTDPFTVGCDEGDVLEVQTENVGDSLTGTRVTANEGHPIAVFSAQECAFIPEDTHGCDHLEDQLPALKFWGTEFVASRLPQRSTGPMTEDVLWQIYASEDETEVSISASSAVLGLPFESAVLGQGNLFELLVHGTQAIPGDFFVQADKPIALVQYMTGAMGDNSENTGDPSMVYMPPTEQFLPLNIVLVPSTWVNDALVVTRPTASQVLLDDLLLADSEFEPIVDSGYEVARLEVSDGIHVVEAENGEDGLGVIVVGWDDYDSYAYVGGMRFAVTNF